MKEPLIMTPGPTYVSENVRNALAKPITNPDLDPQFFEFYRETCEGIKAFLKTQNDAIIMCGEGILGLEAACASLIEPGDRILCIDNGIFGRGFGDFAKIYGANVVYFQSDYRKAIDVKSLEKFLDNDSSFKLATVIHCETPSGITNPVNIICPMLKKHNILTVVDTVSAAGGEKLETDLWNIDIALCASQKCISAPPGLTFFSVSSDAWYVIQNRKTPVAGFYTNIGLWKNWYDEKWFPYTQPISDIYALREAIDRILTDKDFQKKHEAIASKVRKSIVNAGLELYPLDGFSNTVTSVLMPEEIIFKELFDEMLNKHNVLIAGAFDILKDKVFRIGHMGENCSEEKIYLTLKALNDVLKNHGIKLKSDLHREFINM